MSNEPKWSTTPPEESGTYWVREVETKITTTAFVDSVGGIWGLGGGIEEIEWYPVRIEEPPL
jgi:hypothetical protein